MKQKRSYPHPSAGPCELGQRRWSPAARTVLSARLSLSPLTFRDTENDTHTSSATSSQAGRLHPGGALDHGALEIFAEDTDPVAAHDAPVIGVADIGDAVPDHGTLVDG